MRRRRLTAIAAGLLLAALAACGPSGEAGEPKPEVLALEIRQLDRGADRPNLVLVVICSLRYEHLGFAGYARDTTPFLDSLVEGGVRFANAMASSTWTKPTTASILTGLTPNVHQMTEYYESRTITSRGFAPKRTLADAIVTLPEALGAAGYATFGRNNNMHAGHFFNMMQGFEDAGPPVSGAQTPALLRDFERWLEAQDPTRPFFFFLLTRDAHVPYRPAYAHYRRFSGSPVPEDGYDDFALELKKTLTRAERSGALITDEQKRDFVDLYDGELAQLDAALAELPPILERAGRGERTILVVTADHGERFFDPHGAVSHGGAIFDEPLVHVPLLFHGPGVPEGAVIEDLVRSIDLYPTLAELGGVRPPDVVQGRSLVPLLTGAGELPRVSAFASFEERAGEGAPGAQPARRAHAVRLRRHKLQQRADGSLVLHDLESDPRELMDRVAEDPETVVNLRGELDRWLAEEQALRALVAGGEARELTPDVIEQLRELGYVEELEEGR